MSNGRKEVVLYGLLNIKPNKTRPLFLQGFLLLCLQGFTVIFEKIKICKMKSKFPQSIISRAPHIYKVWVEYQKEYFTDKRAKRKRVVFFASTTERDTAYIQSNYRHCTVLKIEKIK